MPRFYFDVMDGEGIIDEEGEELEDLYAARIVAVRLSGELLRDHPDRFWTVGERSCSVRDESGLILFVLHFHVTEAPAVSRPLGECPQPLCRNRTLDPCYVLDDVNLR